eukprot:PhM_4_TR9517/c2_g3_i11/m.98282
MKNTDRKSNTSCRTSCSSSSNNSRSSNDNPDLDGNDDNSNEVHSFASISVGSAATASRSSTVTVTTPTSSGRDGVVFPAYVQRRSSILKTNPIRRRATIAATKKETLTIRRVSLAVFTSQIMKIHGDNKKYDNSDEEINNNNNISDDGESEFSGGAEQKESKRRRKSRQQAWLYETDCTTLHFRSTSVEERYVASLYVELGFLGVIIVPIMFILSLFTIALLIFQKEDSVSYLRHPGMTIAAVCCGFMTLFLCMSFRVYRNRRRCAEGMMRFDRYFAIAGIFALVSLLVLRIWTVKHIEDSLVDVLGHTTFIGVMMRMRFSAYIIMYLPVAVCISVLYALYFGPIYSMWGCLICWSRRSWRRSRAPRCASSPRGAARRRRSGIPTPRWWSRTRAVSLRGRRARALWT